MSGVFYPQCVAALQVVFDGFGSSGLGGFGQLYDPYPTTGPLNPYPGGDSKPTVLHVRPKTATVHLNGYREADTFEMEFDAAHFPFSPELVRSMAVQLHLFQTTNLTGNVENFNDETENLVIAGLVDEASYHAGSDGRTFRVTGRDYTCLLLDKQWDPTRRVPVGKPLDQCIQDLVDEATHKATTGTTLKVKAIGTDSFPTLEEDGVKEDALITAGKFNVSKKGKLSVPTTGNGHTKVNKKGVPVKGGSNYWDVIYRLCLRHGFVCYVRGTDLILSTPQTLTEATSGRVRSVALGQDLSTLDIDRKMGKETVPQIIVTCYDSKSKKKIQGVWPLSRQQKTTGLGTRRDEVRVVTVAGISDPGVLQNIAKTYYHSLARGEATIKFQTRDLKDLNGNDLLFLRPGDPVSIGFDAVNDEEFKQISAFQRYQKLLGMGYDEEVANLIATEYDRINQFRQPFYCRDVQFDWSLDQGLMIEVQGINFVSVGRDDVK